MTGACRLNGNRQKDTWLPPTTHPALSQTPHLRFRDGREEGGRGGYWYKGLRDPGAAAARGGPCSSHRLLREGPGCRGDEGRDLGHAHQGQSQHAQRPHLSCQISGELIDVWTNQLVGVSIIGRKMGNLRHVW